MTVAVIRLRRGLMGFTVSVKVVSGNCTPSMSLSHALISCLLAVLPQHSLSDWPIATIRVIAGRRCGCLGEKRCVTCRRVSLCK